jgi:hypothetical protein
MIRYCARLPLVGPDSPKLIRKEISSHLPQKRLSGSSFDENMLIRGPDPRRCRGLLRFRLRLFYKPVDANQIDRRLPMPVAYKKDLLAIR